MPYIPHTEEDILAMLQSIGATSIDSLFDEIPNHLKNVSFKNLPQASHELSLKKWMQNRSNEDSVHLNFMGAGAYEHFIPSVVWEIASRGEWMTPYTPYQAEASQGILQLLYEYQTMMCQLMHLEISNASLYEGASALAEAVLMAVRCQEKEKSRSKNHLTSKPAVILVPETVHPHYRQVVKTIVSPQNIEIVELPYCAKRGITELSSLKSFENKNVTALIIPQPNFFGSLEEVDELTQWAHSHNALVIGVVNPLAMGLLQPPGLWGDGQGADIACGEGQPLGIPLTSGGPYFGFLCCKKTFIRQLPGRLVGRTTDKKGETGFTLTLQAREQHIRRAKATSNICTNQGLMVTAATLYMSLMGARGLRAIAAKCHENAVYLCDKLTQIKGVSRCFNSSYFHEFVLQFPMDSEILMQKLEKKAILPGVCLANYYSSLKNCLLIAVTETKSTSDLDEFAEQIKAVLGFEVSPC